MQASQQLGWSAIPRSSTDTGDSSLNPPVRSPTTAATAAAALAASPTSGAGTGDAPGGALSALAAMSKLKPTAPEYQPGRGLQAPERPATGGGTGVGAKAAAAGGHGNHYIKSLEALQLPDGFSAGDD